MKIVRFSTGKKTSCGIWNGDIIQGVSGTPFGRLKPNGENYKLSEVKLLSPCKPSKIPALGLNYRKHAEEVKMPIPKEPLLFLKPSTSVIGPEDNIICPEMSRRVDYEGELGIVIGKRTWRVSEKDANDYILGYTCVNDVTARDLQGKDGQWTRSKGFDTFAPIGPCIVTDIDPGDLAIETCLNGVTKQKSSTSDLIFSVKELVSFISRVMTLLPGDVIATGTPSGIGPMKAGDTVEVKIEKIGTLLNHVV
jgi:2-keto-4-pentenoate hydratase/2-oxohepta-3-ene-1,7-dioic acid hydratase in catechol pathway